MSDTQRSLVRAADGLVALNSTIELMRDLRRPRADLCEVAVCDGTLDSDGRDVCLTHQVDNEGIEGIVIPETIDCVRAMIGIERDAATSIAKADQSLGITKTFFHT